MEWTISILVITNHQIFFIGVEKSYGKSNSVKGKLNISSIRRRIYRTCQTHRVVRIFRMVRKYQTDYQQIRDENQNQKVKLNGVKLNH